MATVKKRKYGNRKITVDGITYDSKKEYERHRELLLMEKAGRITGLQRQVRFVLMPAQYEKVERFSKKTGKRLEDGYVCAEREVSYIADFVYTENGELVVEDVKGFKTPDYILKRKLMLYVHGIRIKET